MLEQQDLRTIDYLHGGFALTDRPFAQAAGHLGCTEDELIERIKRLLAQGYLTRFGPLFQIEQAGGRFILAAMDVPQDRFESVAQIVNALPEVAHNYRRASQNPESPQATALNMWFVLALEFDHQSTKVVEKIEHLTGLKVLTFPKEREFRVQLRLPILPEKEQQHPKASIP